MLAKLVEQFIVIGDLPDNCSTLNDIFVRIVIIIPDDLTSR